MLVYLLSICRSFKDEFKRIFYISDTTEPNIHIELSIYKTFGVCKSISSVLSNEPLHSLLICFQVLRYQFLLFRTFGIYILVVTNRNVIHISPTRFGFGAFGHKPLDFVAIRFGAIFPTVVAQMFVKTTLKMHFN